MTVKQAVYNRGKTGVTATVPGYDKIPTYLNPEQRHALTQIPPDLSDRDIAQYDTFTEKERDLINRRRRPPNRLGFAVHRLKA